MSKYKNIPYENSFAYHIEVKLGLNLDDIWNWELNNKNGINPYEITKCSGKKVWLYCQEHDYHNYDREGNKVGYQIRCSSFYNGTRCGYCNPFASKKVHWKDSLAYKYPQVARMIANVPKNNKSFDDFYNIASHSEKEKYYVECPNCKIVSNEKKYLRDILQGYSCKFCSDGISIPNKFMYDLLTQLNENFESEYSPYYFRNKQSVDFLLTNYNIILEMDGGYGNHTREYDLWRDFLNMKYGGYKTIRIDLTDDDKYNLIYDGLRKLLMLNEQTIKNDLFVDNKIR